MKALAEKSESQTKYHAHILLDQRLLLVLLHAELGLLDEGRTAAAHPVSHALTSVLPVGAAPGGPPGVAQVVADGVGARVGSVTAEATHDVVVLHAVKVKVDGAVERHEKVTDVRDGLDPWRPLSLVLAGQPPQLVQVGDPLDGVTQNEDAGDGQGDLGQSDLVLLGVGELAAEGRLTLDDEAPESEGVEDDQEAEGHHAHEDEVHPDAVDLDVVLVDSHVGGFDGEFVHGLVVGHVQRVGVVWHLVAGDELEEFGAVVEKAEGDDGDDVTAGRPLVGDGEEWVAHSQVPLEADGQS